jgi:tyrosyl-tRNA synthetase
LAQAMDSAAIESDVELGGTDQKFNLLVGREIQKAYEKQPQCILTMPILEGTDGVEKMSKSLDNYIAFTDTPREMFGKAMSIPDELIVRYFRYGVRAPEDDIMAMDKGLQDGSVHPRDAKVKTAMGIVEIYHDEAAAKGAFEEFERMFVKKDLPDNIDEVELEFDSDEPGILDILAVGKMCPSKKEARRMVDQGAVSVDGEKVSDFRATYELSDYRLFKVGKRKFLRIKKK